VQVCHFAHFCHACKSDCSVAYSPWSLEYLYQICCNLVKQFLRYGQVPNTYTLPLSRTIAPRHPPTLFPWGSQSSPLLTQCVVEHHESSRQAANHQTTNQPSAVCAQYTNITNRQQIQHATRHLSIRPKNATIKNRQCMKQIEQSFIANVKLNKCSAVAEIGDRLATVDMGRKWGAAVSPFFGGGSWVPI